MIRTSLTPVTSQTTKQQQIMRLMHRIERNCEAMVRIMDEPGFLAMEGAMYKRVQAFARREEQLMELVGPMQSHVMAFEVLREVLRQR